MKKIDQNTRKGKVTKVPLCILLDDEESEDLVVDLHGQKYEIEKILTHEGYKDDRPLKLTGDLSKYHAK